MTYVKVFLAYYNDLIRKIQQLEGNKTANQNRIPKINQKIILVWKFNSAKLLQENNILTKQFQIPDLPLPDKLFRVATIVVN